MAGVFLSYSRADRALAEQVIRALRRIGVEVWWDQDMPGVDWQQELERELAAMVAVAVIWTPNSMASKYVRDEARLGLHFDKLVNVMAGAAAPPFPFDRVNGLPIDGWDGVSPHSGWTRVVQTIDTLAVAAGGAKAGEIIARLKLSEEDVRAKRVTLDEAEVAFHDAQSLETEASEADRPASEARKRAEDDLERIRATPVGPAILRAAQQEFDAAEASSNETSRALRAARAQLSAAARTLARAKADWEALASDAVRPAERPEPERSQPRSPPKDVEVEDRPARPEPAAPAKAVQAPTQSPGIPTRALWVAAGVLVVFALGVVVLEAVPAFHRPGPSNPSAQAASAADSGQTDSVASGAPAVSAATADPAAPLIGSWSIAGLGCDSPVTFSEANGVLTRTFAGAKTPVAQVRFDYSRFYTPDGTRYEFSPPDSLSMIPAGATKAMTMTRCAA